MTQVKCKIQKGDQVIVTTGKDKGAKGEVTQVLLDQSRVVVQGVNMVKKNQKPSQMGPGGITNVERSIHISNVALIDPKSGKATRTGYKLGKDGSKERIARKSGEKIAAPSYKKSKGKGA
ncbi:MAG: 50S ribosomal protein L24 [Alphaproteobacteria bacterium]|nr:50S ribosomal protein L24 [Alphaproteobacteria bacterium]